MRVLHYIDHVRREDLLSAYLTALTTVQEQLGVEVCVATHCAARQLQIVWTWTI